MILLLIAAILVLFLVSMTTYEHMTNKDVISAIQKYGSKDDKPTPKKTNPSEAPIYGPKTEPVVHPTPSSKTKGTDNSTSAYPEIYGPDVVASPGEKIKHAKESSDNVDNEVYDYNPDLAKAFPTNGPPQPFLTDFSKFQH